jgi:hypothetical protein
MTDNKLCATVIGAAMLAGSLVLVGSVVRAQPAGPPPGYFDIPAGFDFPANKQTLEQFRATGNLLAQRLHVWNVFAGLTQPTPDGKHAIFETWYSSDETFQSGPSLQANAPRRVVRRFAPPRQFEGLPGQPGLQAAGTGLFSEVMFNYANHNHVRTQRLYLQSTLQTLKQTGAADPAIPNNRTIPAFPAESISLKTVWWPVRKTGMTALPVWDPEFNPGMPADKPFQQWKGNPPERWARAVAVDPARKSIPEGETAVARFSGTTFPHAKVVSIEAFHYFELDEQGANAIMANDRTRSFIEGLFGQGATVEAGDFVVFLGTHLTTKEIDDWVWATFWWHDRPNVGQFSGDRPASVKNEWRNYLMSVSFDLELPRESDGSPHVAFNPWLEAHFPGGGIVSNCTNCHNRASWTGPPGPPNAPGRFPSFMPIFRGKPNLVNDPAYRAGQLRTDFLWSLPFEAKQ